MSIVYDIILLARKYCPQTVDGFHFQSKYRQTFDLTQFLEVQSCEYYLTWNRKTTISATCMVVGVFSKFCPLSLSITMSYIPAVYLNWQMCVLNMLLQKWFILIIHYSKKCGQNIIKFYSALLTKGSQKITTEFLLFFSFTKKLPYILLAKKAAKISPKNLVDHVLKKKVVAKTFPLFYTEKNVAEVPL